MQYKGYTGTMIELDEEFVTIHGRVSLRRGMATFEGTTALDAIQAFRESVDDYLVMCMKHGIEPDCPTSALSASASIRSRCDRGTTSFPYDSASITGSCRLPGERP